MNHTAALPDPDHTDPEQARWVAGYERAEQAAAEKLIEEAAQVMHGSSVPSGASWSQVPDSLKDMWVRYARALHAAGLLRKVDQ